MVGILLSYWDDLFSGAMLVSGRAIVFLFKKWGPIFSGGLWMLVGASYLRKKKMDSLGQLLGVIHWERFRCFPKKGWAPKMDGENHGTPYDLGGFPTPIFGVFPPHWSTNPSV